MFKNATMKAKESECQTYETRMKELVMFSLGEGKKKAMEGVKKLNYTSK